ncbi:MAG: hypothetical protein CVV49_21715 [Spirochaetae bacterium HGW-Spirochaetae-5]|nr:MAG: hypothetical protein CVV49_21715 [Spirochaetae bacterium HGW-Spirochaetae-5]
MKQIKYLVALALAAAVTMPAMADPKVTFSGGAKVRYGFQYMEVDENSMTSIAFLSGLREDNNNAKLYGILANPAAYAALKASFDSGSTAVTKATLYGVTSVADLAAFNTKYGTNFTDASLDQAIADYRSRKHAKALFTGQKQEQAAALNMKVEDDKLTVKIGVEVDSEKELEVKQAAFSFDYGFGAITYDAAGSQNRWNENIFYVGGSDENNDGISSVDFTFIPAPQMGNIFLTLISNKANSSAVKYENNDDRIIPITQLGYEYTSAMIDAKVGGVYDKYKGETAANDYTGYLGFGNVTVKLGNIKELETGSMAFGLSGLYGQNVSTFAPMDTADMESATISVSQIASAKSPLDDPILVAKSGDDDAKVWGGLVFFAGSFWKGGLVYTDFRYSEVKWGSNDPFSAYKFQVSITQYFNKNFYIMPGAGYEAYSVVAGDKGIDKAWGYEGVIEAGYKF